LLQTWGELHCKWDNGQEGGRYPSPLILQEQKILAVLQITRMDGRMGGRIVGHDNVGRWLLGKWLLADMLLWIWVKRLSCGCVVVDSVPN
jgi:hypothetical protein